jgi:ferredoxin
MRKSSRVFYKEARSAPGFSLLKWIHGYIYMRWPYFYISMGTGEHRLAKILLPFLRWIALRLTGSSASGKEESSRSFADSYHGKVLTLSAAEELITINQNISLVNLEKVIPYRQAKDLILRHPDHIVVLDCPCRLARPNPCLPLDVCLVVGEPFASFAAEHHPNRSRWITPGEAVGILKEEAARGHVHHAFFKDAMLERYYAICNCCSCCCGALQAHRFGTPMLASSGYVVRKDERVCEQCGDCLEICPFGAFNRKGEEIHPDPSKCMGCGLCVSRCSNGALTLQRDASGSEPLEIVQLLNQSPAA